MKNIIGKTITNGVSIVTAIKNRSEHLEESLPTWLANKHINEVIIVDWSSDTAVFGIINKFINHHKIILVRAENEPKWILSHAYNLGLSFTSRTQVLKLDSDIKLNEDFFDYYKLNSKIFLTGRWELARNKNEAHLNGSIFANRKDLMQVSGYDERITAYGWDDSDLYSRLEKIGIQRNNIHPDHLSHIPHDDLLRTKHQTIEEEYKNDLAKLIIKHTEATYNRIPWGEEEKHTATEFDIHKENTKYFTCKRKPAKIYVIVSGDISNRLRDYFVSKKISEDINKELVLIWEVDADCNFLFSDFFKNEIVIENKFNINSFNSSTKFYFLDNENFENQDIAINSNNDIVIKAKNGFSYDNDNIMPLQNLSTSLKQYIKHNFKKLVPVEPNAMLLKNISTDIIKTYVDKKNKSNAIISNIKKATTTKKIHDYKTAITKLHDSLRDYINSNKLKSLILGISGGVNSTVSACICSKICKELDIPLIGVYVIMDGSEDITLVNGAGATFCDELKKINLTTEYTSYTKHMDTSKSDELANIKNGLIIMYLNNLARTNNGILISTKSQMDSMIGFYNIIGNVNELNLLDGFFKSEIYRMGKFLANKYVKRVKDKQILHKAIGASPTQKLNRYGVSTYVEAESILKDFLNGNEKLNIHPLIKSYKDNNFRKTTLINRSDLVNTD